MFFCEMCGSGDCCERTDIYGGPILCDTCYIEAKQDQEDRDTIEISIHKALASLDVWPAGFAAWY